MRTLRPPVAPIVAALAAAVLALVPAGGLAQVSPLGEIGRRAEPLAPGTTALGTGFFIAPDRILTSAHVLAGCRTVVVTNPVMGTIAARLLSRDRARDSALLSTERASPVFVRLAAAAPRPGARLSILGYPGGRRAGEGPARFSGRQEARLTDADGVPILALGARVPAGVSGGPVLDAAGSLVGILVGRRDAVPQTVVALSAEALPRATRRAFRPGERLPMPGIEEAIAATVQIRCR